MTHEEMDALINQADAAQEFADRARKLVRFHAKRMSRETALQEIYTISRDSRGTAADRLATIEIIAEANMNLGAENVE